MRRRQALSSLALAACLLFALAVCQLVALAPVPAAAQGLVDRHALRDDLREWVGEPVTLSLRDADLVEVLRSFSRIGEFNLLIHPGVEGRVTVEFREVPWDQALSTILRMHGLGLEITGAGTPGQTVEIGTHDQLAAAVGRHGDPALGATSELARRRTLRGTLEHLDARIVARALAAGSAGGGALLLSDAGVARAEDARTLVIVDRLPRLERLGRLLAALDVPENAGLGVDALRRRATSLGGARD